MTAPDYEIPRDVVPPGNQTGTYYIPISNLPFNVSWQEVKDHVRQVCAVDHVEIFPKSTSGWVRVKGFDDFRAAFELLNGKEFKGRAVIADDRNADRPLKVRDLVVSAAGGPTTQPASSSSPKSAVESAPESSLFAGGPVSYPSTIGISSPTSTASSAYGQVRSDRPKSSYHLRSLPPSDQGPLQNHCHFHVPAAQVLMPTCSAQDGTFSMPMSPSSYMTSPGSSFSHRPIIPSCDAQTTTYPQAGVPTATYGYYGSGVGAQQPFYGYHAAPDRQSALYNPSAPYAVQPIQNYNEYYPPPPPPPPPSMAVLTNQMADLTMGGAMGTSGSVVLTEQRGIFIRELSRRASGEQVRRMICEAAGRESSLINKIDVPLDKEGSPRGYAHVHFRSADCAQRMQARLHGVEFKGKKLQVRLLKEGEAVGVSGSGAVTSSPARGHGHGHRSGRHHSSSVGRDEGRRTERKERDKEKGSDRGEKKVSPTAPSSSSKGMPLVVGGGSSGAEASSPSYSSPSSSSQTKDKGKEKYGSKKSAVVIADGSSRRADKS